MLKDDFNNFSVCKVKPPGGTKVGLCPVFNLVYDFLLFVCLHFVPVHNKVCHCHVST